MNQQDRSFALWLRPRQSEIDSLSRLISQLSHQHQTTPFPPHITLLSGIGLNVQRIKRHCENICKSQSIFTVNLRSIQYTEKYFMNLFIPIEMNNELLNLRNNFIKMLELDINEEFIPHISLLYGNLHISQQQKLQVELNKSFPKTIHCERIDIYVGTGDESQWYLEESISLK